jgi:hypothetical protein
VKNGRNGCELLLDALKDVGIGRRDRFPDYEGMFQLGTYKQSTEENVEVMEHIRPNSLLQPESMKLALLRKKN